MMQVAADRIIGEVAALDTWLLSLSDTPVSAVSPLVTIERKNTGPSTSVVGLFNTVPRSCQVPPGSSTWSSIVIDGDSAL